MKLSGHERRNDVRCLQFEISWEDLTATPHDRRAEKDGQGVSFATYRPSCSCGEPTCPGEAGHRIDANVLEVTALGLDLDKRILPDVTQADIDPAYATWCITRLSELGLNAWIYSTHSATPERPSLRAVIRLSRPVPAASWRRFWRAAINHLGIFVQNACQNEARFWYLPSAPEGAEVINVVLPGQPLDVDQILLTASETDEKPPATTKTGEKPLTAEPRILEAVRDALRRHGPAIEGEGGDQHTFLAACICRDHGLDDEQALELLAEWDVSNSPPWGGDLEDKVRNAYRYAKGEEGSKALDVAIADAVAAVARPSGPFVPPAAVAAPEAGTWEHTLWQAFEDLKAYRGTGEAAAGKLSAPAFAPAGNLLTTTFPPTPWLIQGLVTEKSVGVTSAEPKSIKTWIELENALAVATGTPSLGEFHTGTPRPAALFLAEDDARSARNRLRSLAKSRGLDPAKAFENLHVACRQHLNILQDTDLVWIIASCRQIPGLALVVIDPLRDVHGADENDSTGMADVMGRLRTIRDLCSCAVRTPHHAKKSASAGDRGGQNMRGSSAIHGALDCGMYLDGLDSDGKAKWSVRVSVEIKAARGAGVFELALVVEDDANGEALIARWLVPKDETSKVDPEVISEASSEVLNDLAAAELHGRKTTAKEIRRRVTGGLEGITEALEDLERRGLVERDMYKKQQRGWKLTAAGRVVQKGPPAAPTA